MKFIKDTYAHQHLIQKFTEKPFSIQINHQSHNSSIIISSDSLQPITHSYDQINLVELISQHINQHHFEILLIGTGSKLILPPPELTLLCHQHKIGIESMNTHSACRTHNILLQDRRRIVTLLSS